MSEYSEAKSSRQTTVQYFMTSARPSAVGAPRWSNSTQLERSTVSRPRSDRPRRMTADGRLQPVRADHGISVLPPGSTTAGSTTAFSTASRTTYRSVGAAETGALGLKDPELERTFRGHSGGITAVSFSPDMKQLVSSSSDRCLMLWSFRSQLRAIRFKGHTALVHHAEFSPDGSLVASASRDRTVRLWTPSARGGCSVLKGHMGGVRHVSFSRNGRLLITASEDKTVKIWSLPSQKFVCTLTGHNNWVRCASFSPDSRLAVSCGDDKTVRLWDVKTQDCLHTFFDHDASVGQAKFHPDGTCVASCSADKTIKVWDARSHQLLQHYPAHDCEVTSISFHESGNFLLSSSNDSTLKIWDLREGRLLYTLTGHAGPSTATTFNPDGTLFASGGADGVVLSWKSHLSARNNGGLSKSGGGGRRAVTSPSPVAKRRARPRGADSARADGRGRAARGNRTALSPRTPNTRIGTKTRPPPSSASVTGLRRPGGHAGAERSWGGRGLDEVDILCRRATDLPLGAGAQAATGRDAYDDQQFRQEDETFGRGYLEDSRLPPPPPPPPPLVAAYGHNENDIDIANSTASAAAGSRGLEQTSREQASRNVQQSNVMRMMVMPDARNRASDLDWGVGPSRTQAQGMRGRTWEGGDLGFGARGSGGHGVGGGEAELDRRDLPKGLNAALEEIVTQMDTLTQAMGMVEKRLCVMEDRLACSSSERGRAGGAAGGGN